MIKTNLGDQNSWPLPDHFAVGDHLVTALEVLVHWPWQKAWKAPAPTGRGLGTFDVCRAAALLSTASALHRRRFGVGLRYVTGTYRVMSKRNE